MDGLKDDRLTVPEQLLGVTAQKHVIEQTRIRSWR